MAVRWRSGSEFNQVALGDMDRLNGQDTGPIILGCEPAEQPITQEERPVFYWRVVYPRGGITHDWYFTFREVHIRPLAPTSLEDLLVWFDYQQPGNVELSLVDRQPDPRYQIINYDWF